MYPVIFKKPVCINTQLLQKGRLYTVNVLAKLLPNVRLLFIIVE